jgi:hypothetical protein
VTHAQCKAQESNALLLACVIWAAGLTVALAGLLAYVAVQTYDPVTSCGDLLNEAVNAQPAEAVRLLQRADDRDCGSIGP